MLDHVANQRIAHPDYRHQHRDADNPAGAAFAHQRCGNKDDCRNKENISAEKRHEHIENGVAQRQVYEPEQADINRLQPMHRHFFSSPAPWSWPRVARAMASRRLSSRNGLLMMKSTPGIEPAEV